LKAQQRQANCEKMRTMADNLGTVGVILAGGLARRMGGGDKPMRDIGGRTILDDVVSRFRPQCDDLLLNANGDPERLSAFGLPVIADSIADYPGPLAGILAALDWTATHRPAVSWVASAAGDCPFLPRDLVARLHDARAQIDATLVVAQSGAQRHPVAGLWRVDIREELRGALLSGVRKIQLWTGHYPIAVATWAIDPVDPFFNVNTSEDLAEAKRLARLVEQGGKTGETASNS
jgi:molybdopterin-guanine dinucleotide biosynthesis protein A